MGVTTDRVNFEISVQRAGNWEALATIGALQRDGATIRLRLNAQDAASVINFYTSRTQQAVKSLQTQMNEAVKTAQQQQKATLTAAQTTAIRRDVVTQYGTSAIRQLKRTPIDQIDQILSDRVSDLHKHLKTKGLNQDIIKQVEDSIEVISRFGGQILTRARNKAERAEQRAVRAYESDFGVKDLFMQAKARITRNYTDFQQLEEDKARRAGKLQPGAPLPPRLQGAVDQRVRGRALDFGQPFRSSEGLTQLGFAALYGGIPTLLGGIIGGSTQLGTKGIQLGSSLVQGVTTVAAAIIEPIIKRKDEIEEAGKAFERSILGITAVLQQSSEVISRKTGQPLGPDQLNRQLEFQQERARNIQLAARAKVIPLGIAGQTEATLVQGIVSSIASRGFKFTPDQVATLAERIGGGVLVQRPQLLENTTLFLRDLQDLLSGGPQAKRVLISQLAGFREAVPGVVQARSTEDLIKATESLAKFPEVAKNLNNPITTIQQLTGAYDQLSTSAGDVYLKTITPALRELFKVVSTPQAVRGAESLGKALGELVGILTRVGSTATRASVAANIGLEAGENFVSGSTVSTAMQLERDAKLRSMVTPEERQAVEAYGILGSFFAPLGAASRSVATGKTVETRATTEEIFEQLRIDQSRREYTERVLKRNPKARSAESVFPYPSSSTEEDLDTVENRRKYLEGLLNVSGREKAKQELEDQLVFSPTAIKEYLSKLSAEASGGIFTGKNTKAQPLLQVLALQQLSGIESNQAAERLGLLSKQTFGGQRVAIADQSKSSTEEIARQKDIALVLERALAGALVSRDPNQILKSSVGGIIDQLIETHKRITDESNKQLELARLETDLVKQEFELRKQAITTLSSVGEGFAADNQIKGAEAAFQSKANEINRIDTDIASLTDTIKKNKAFLKQSTELGAFERERIDNYTRGLEGRVASLKKDREVAELEQDVFATQKQMGERAEILARRKKIEEELIGVDTGTFAGQSTEIENQKKLIQFDKAEALKRTEELRKQIAEKEKGGSVAKSLRDEFEEQVLRYRGAFGRESQTETKQVQLDARRTESAQSLLKAQEALKFATQDEKNRREALNLSITASKIALDNFEASANAARLGAQESALSAEIRAVKAGNAPSGRFGDVTDPEQLAALEKKFSGQARTVSFESLDRLDTELEQQRKQMELGLRQQQQELERLPIAARDAAVALDALRKSIEDLQKAAKSITGVPAPLSPPPTGSGNGSSSKKEPPKPRPQAFIPPYLPPGWDQGMGMDTPEELVPITGNTTISGAIGRTSTSIFDRMRPGEQGYGKNYVFPSMSAYMPPWEAQEGVDFIRLQEAGRRGSIYSDHKPGEMKVQYYLDNERRGNLFQDHKPGEMKMEGVSKIFGREPSAYVRTQAGPSPSQKFFGGMSQKDWAEKEYGKGRDWGQVASLMDQLWALPYTGDPKDLQTPEYTRLYQQLYAPGIGNNRDPMGPRQPMGPFKPPSKVPGKSTSATSARGGAQPYITEEYLQANSIVPIGLPLPPEQFFSRSYRTPFNAAAMPVSLEAPLPPGMVQAPSTAVPRPQGTSQDPVKDFVMAISTPIRQAFTNPDLSPGGGYPASTQGAQFKQQGMTADEMKQIMEGYSRQTLNVRITPDSAPVLQQAHVSALNQL